MAAKGHRKETPHNTAPIEDCIKELKAKFGEFDGDGDGSLSIFEFRDLLRESTLPMMSDRAIQGLFVHIDSCQGDKKITKAEINRLEEEVKRAKEGFRVTDTDNSGFLDKKELREVLKMCGLDDEKIVDEIFRVADTSGDGKVTVDEFINAYLQS